MKRERMSAACAERPVTLRTLLPGAGAGDHALAALVLLSLGVLEDDGLTVAVGHAAMLASAGFFAVLLCVGWSGLRALAGL